MYRTILAAVLFALTFSPAARAGDSAAPDELEATLVVGDFAFDGWMTYCPDIDLTASDYDLDAAVGVFDTGNQLFALAIWDTSDSVYDSFTQPAGDEPTPEAFVEIPDGDGTRVFFVALIERGEISFTTCGCSHL